MVVDDEYSIRMLLREMFLDKGYEVLTAETGKEALDKLDENDISLMIIDYKLPGMDGLTVVDELIKRDDSTSVILMSGMFDTRNQTISRNPLIKHTMAKPFDVQELFDYVEDIIK